MKTRLDLLSAPTTWIWTAIILAAATLGKVGGASLAGLWTGRSWRDSLALGVLLNTRGLVELIVLNIGYSPGIFSPTLFTMLTTPVLDLLKVQKKVRFGDTVGKD